MIKTFKKRDIYDLESKVNDWIYSNIDCEVKHIQFEIGIEDNKECHYAYLWYEKLDDDR